MLGIGGPGGDGGGGGLGVGRRLDRAGWTGGVGVGAGSVERRYQACGFDPSTLDRNSVYT